MSIFDHSLIYVTGKGGVGKTTVAAALGMAAARLGRRTIVCEVAEQDRLHRVFARQGVGARETELADDLYAVTVDPQDALEEWLSKQLGGGPVFRTLLRSSAFQYFVAAAPGAKELITIAKVWETAQLERWTKSNRSYDLVIVDAPASGHGVAMLQTPQTYGDIARIGPIHRQASKITRLLRDPERTAYVGVCLPEEMPVAETLDLQDRLAATVGQPLGTVIVNALLPERFTRAELERLAGLGDVDGVVSNALAEAARAAAQREHVERLRRGADGRVVTLPFLFDPELGLDAFDRLADVLIAKLD